MDTHECVLCKRTSDLIPLISVEYRSSMFHICSQHLPVLIHDPAQLLGVIPGAENIEPSAHHD